MRYVRAGVPRRRGQKTVRGGPSESWRDSVRGVTPSGRSIHEGHRSATGLVRPSHSRTEADVARHRSPSTDGYRGLRRLPRLRCLRHLQLGHAHAEDEHPPGLIHVVAGRIFADPRLALRGNLLKEPVGRIGVRRHQRSPAVIDSTWRGPSSMHRPSLARHSWGGSPEFANFPISTVLNDLLRIPSVCSIRA